MGVGLAVAVGVTVGVGVDVTTSVENIMGLRTAPTKPYAGSISNLTDVVPAGIGVKNELDCSGERLALVRLANTGVAPLDDV